MDGSNKQTAIHTDSTRGSVSVHRNVLRSWFTKPHDYTKSDRGHKRNRHYKYFLPVIAALTCSPVNAETIGGVSATASPVANSSGSVTNQAIQVLQGPYITNTYGAGIQCQGPTRNFTPYVTGTASAARPWEDYYMDPVYDVSDLDEDGRIDNPGDILFHKKTRTGQKDNFSLGVGFSVTWSTPLDKKLQDQCKEAAQANIDMMTQLTANKRLDFEIARLKNCGELMKAGIMFAPGTKYAAICADVMVMNVSHIKDHRHTIPSPSVSKPSEEQQSLDSDHADQHAAPVRLEVSPFSPEESQSSSSPSSQQASTLSEADRQRVLRAVQRSSQRQQYSQ